MGWDLARGGEGEANKTNRSQDQQKKNSQRENKMARFSRRKRIDQEKGDAMRYNAKTLRRSITAWNERTVRTNPCRSRGRGVVPQTEPGVSSGVFDGDPVFSLADPGFPHSHIPNFHQALSFLSFFLIDLFQPSPSRVTDSILPSPPSPPKPAVSNRCTRSSGNLHAVIPLRFEDHKTTKNPQIRFIKVGGKKSHRTVTHIHHERSTLSTSSSHRASVSCLLGVLFHILEPCHSLADRKFKNKENRFFFSFFIVIGTISLTKSRLGIPQTTQSNP